MTFNNIVAKNSLLACMPTVNCSQ